MSLNALILFLPIRILIRFRPPNLSRIRRVHSLLLFHPNEQGRQSPSSPDITYNQQMRRAYRGELQK